MRGYLLDTSALIALLWQSHAHHELMVKWFSRHRKKGWATCPITESGFVRIVSNPAFSRDAVTPREAVGVLTANTAAKDHQFWTDDLPLAGGTLFIGGRLVGHKQVTDAYLLGLALHRKGVLATLDEGIAALLEPDAEKGKVLEVIS